MTLSDWVMANSFAQIFVGLGLFFLAILVFTLIIVGIEMATGTILGEWPGKINLFFRRR